MGSLLNKKRILITREASQAHNFAQQISEYGGVPIVTPLLKIDSVSNNDNVKTMGQLHQFDWIFFTSINGVNHFFNQLQNKTFPDTCQIAVVGHKTEEALKSYGYNAKFIPTTYNAETMAAEFINKYPYVNNVLFVRGNLSRHVLLDEFSKHNIKYSKIVVYETIVNVDIKGELNQVIQNEIDYITFTSPSTVNAFVKLLDDEQLLDEMRQKYCFCIGTTTEQVAIDHQFTNTFIPDVFTIESIVEKMVEISQKEGSS